MEGYKGIFQILLLLAEHDNELFKTQLEKGLTINERTIEHARDHLAREGYVSVEKRKDDDNRTRIYTSLTEKGKELIPIIKRLEEIL